MAEVFPVGEFLRDELEARGWSHDYLAERMGGDQAQTVCEIGLLLHTPTRGVWLGEATAARLARALGVSAAFLLRLDEMWQVSPAPEGE